MSRSKVQLDIQTIHADDIGEVVGEFYGTPIRVWHPTDAQLREDQDAYLRVASNRTSNDRIAKEELNV